MRQLPVFSDEYWHLKARRNVLWTACPLDWLEATGYDGSDYDPVFRDGVPNDVKGRWRLIREFTERWYGLAMPDVASHREAHQVIEPQPGVWQAESLKQSEALAEDCRGCPSMLDALIDVNAMAHESMGRDERDYLNARGDGRGVASTSKFRQAAI